MAAQRLTNAQSDTFGRSIRIPLRDAQHFIGVGIPAIALGVGLLWGATNYPIGELAILAKFMGGVLAIAGAGVCMVGWDMVRWSGFSISITREFLEIPVAPFWRRKTTRLPLAEIKHMYPHKTPKGSVLIIQTEEETHAIDERWLPPEWPAGAIALRVLARKNLSDWNADRLAATEAQVFGWEKQTFGAVVVDEEEQPRVLWLVERKGDFTSLQEQDLLPPGHRLIPASSQDTWIHAQLRRYQTRLKDSSAG